MEITCDHHVCRFNPRAFVLESVGSSFQSNSESNPIDSPKIDKMDAMIMMM